MDEHLERNDHVDEGGPAGSGLNRWLITAIVAVVAAAGIAFGYGYRQQILVGHMTAQQSMANATISDMQGQVNTLTAKLNDMSAAQQAAAEAQAKTAAAHAGVKGGKRSSAENKRLKELQTRIDDQQKQLKETQDEVAKNRTDLEGNLSSTRDELNGSIAKTHEELVALAKRGERSFFEFDLTKSKQFQRVGPLTLIWIHTENESQPVQVVVNRVDKNLVHGYVSAPKYKPSELAAGTSGVAAVTPVSDHPQPPDQNPEIPKQPE